MDTNQVADRIFVLAVDHNQRASASGGIECREDLMIE